MFGDQIRRLLAIGMFVVTASAAHAQTVFNGGNVFAGSSWSNGIPSVGNNGTIATNGNFTGVYDFNQNTAGTVTVSITGGTLTSTGANFYNGPVNSTPGWANFQWNQSGGTIDFGGSSGTLSPNLRTTYTFSGGTITATGQSARIIPFNGGRFNQTGGLLNRMGFELTDNINPFGMRIHTLSGGTGTNVWRFHTNTNNTAIIDGNFTLNFTPTTPTSEITTFNQGVMNFQDTWTGSWTRDNFTAADWQTIFTRTGMQYEGTQITATNFSTIFSLANPGAVGSTISIVPVPEPASLLATASLAFGFLIRRKLRNSGNRA
jgi:hypothetical protein